jgi:hypothetical protein
MGSGGSSSLHDGVRVITNPGSGSKAASKDSVVYEPPEGNGQPVPGNGDGISYIPDNVWLEISGVELYHVPGDGIITESDVSSKVAFIPPTIPDDVVFSSESESSLDLELAEEPTYSESYEMIVTNISDIGIFIDDSEESGSVEERFNRLIYTQGLVFVDSSIMSRILYIGDIEFPVDEDWMNSNGLTFIEKNLINSIQDCVASGEMLQMDSLMIIPVEDLVINLSGGGAVTAVNIGLYWDLAVEHIGTGEYGLIDVMDPDYAGSPGPPYDWNIARSRAEVYWTFWHDIKVDVTFDQEELPEEEPADQDVIENDPTT